MYKMNVLHISPDFNYSCGVSKYVFLLLEELSKKESLRLFFITNKGDSLERLDGLNVKVDFLNFERGNRNPYKFLVNYFYLLNYCKANKIDLIHTHHRYPELVSYLVGKRLGIKTITTVHSLVSGWKYLSFRSDRIIAVSKAVMHLLIEKYRVNSRKISQIYNFVKPFNYHKAKEEDRLKEELGIKVTDRVLLFVGRISYTKGCDVLISAFENLLNEFPSLKLIMIGSFESEELMQSVLRNKAIIYLDPTPDIVNYYSICNVVVIPSIIDSFPYVMLEAGLTEKPFIGGRTGGTAEFIEDGIDGLLVKTGCIDDLVISIKRILNDTDLSEKLSRNLSSKVNNLTNAESYSDKITKLYSGLIHETHR
ncbi:MAG: glycosyltransferase family 4 protein [Ignavibacteriales bacterium]|nr:glycosyltransferase family 4 protein [Ignavibacteriales bacterium]